MTPQQLVGLALRLASIWLAVLAFQCYTLTNAAFGFLQEDITLAWIAVALLPAALAAILWMFPMLAAHKLLPPARDASAPSIQEAAAVALIVLGILTVLQAAPHIFGGVSLSLITRGTDLASNYFQGARELQFIASILQYGLGLCLLCMPRLIARRIFPSSSLSTN